MLSRPTSLKHILSVDQFNAQDLKELIRSAEEMRELVETQGGNDSMSHRVSANLFYEPSTRTSSSFAASMYRLGGKVISINDVHYSSVAKGETLEDTIRTLEQYADCIVLRHPEKGAAAIAASVASVPIINAGDGVGEHPTQALLDLFTIFEEQGGVQNLTIAMVGDLKNGRTVHSLAKLLEHYRVTLKFVSPAELSMPEELKTHLKNPWSEHRTIEEVLPEVDVLYVTRAQKERFASLEEYEAVKDSYVVTPAMLQSAKQTMCIMHPLPRVGEIALEVDSDPRAAYFRQMRFGLYMRMALLNYVLS